MKLNGSAFNLTEMQLQSISNNVNFLHLTNSDLFHKNKRKPFEKVTLRDFDYNITEAVKAKYVFFIDSRQNRNWLSRITKTNNGKRRIKLLKPQNIEIHK